MGKQKFIKKVEDFMGVKLSDEKSKDETIEILLEKLEKRQKKLKEELDKSSSEEKKDDLKESLAIIKKQIQKGNKLL